MSVQHFWRWFTLLSFFLTLIMLVSPSKSDDQFQMLSKLKSAVQHSKTNVFATWTQENKVCSFTGIVCNKNGFVTEINLPQQQLQGVLPFDAICGLRSLEKISMGSNLLHGGITEDLKHCTSFAGPGFGLGDNSFDVTSSFPAELLKLDKLYWLYLSNCSIKGQIPEGISNLTLLENLELSDNQLFGEIPAGIGKLSELVELKPLKLLASLHLFENQFTGDIPEEFGELKYLEEFSLYTNKLTGPLPQKLGSWADFAYIDVSENFLTGPIPPDMCKNGKMTDLLILQNSFTGQVPDSYANCKSLERFRVSKNSLSGSIPAGIWGMPNLFIVDFSMNQFEGPVTPDIGNAKSLALLNLANNRFSGTLPSTISQTSSLVSVQLSSNRFSGEIPSTIGELKNLSSLYLTGNKFSGAIPDSLGLCASLTDINLSGNSFSGNIPESLGSLPTLNSLNLSSNKLSGEIPVSLSRLKLSNLDLSNNQLSGPVPDSFSLEAFREGFEGNPGLCSQNLKSLQPCSRNARTSNQLRVFVSCIVAGLLVLAIFAGCFLFLKLRQNNLDHPLKQSSWNMKSFRILSFNESDVIDAIKSENLIGKGGSGNVYKVVLGNGNELAVKHIWTANSIDRRSFRSSSAMLTKKNSRSPEYDAEVATLSNVRHVNVVKLFCSITSDDCNLLAGGQGEWTNNVIAGTHGYIAPEYAYTCKVNEKSDVYSFGVVLMELVTGKRPIEPEFGENKDIVCWVCSKLESKESVIEVVDSNISEVFKGDAMKMLRIAIHCTSRIPALRPSMRMVVHMLEEVEPLQLTDVVVVDKASAGCSKEKVNTGGKSDPSS
ncbi:RECEPTOR-LIKE PROTEIN KINASE HAIKU2 [Salix viminalis]|uniref:non-specific serine/threonine protein kinase n=1 Tax=Salix viminalis TaxID=40686 RepID=A0A9Q0NJP3_SALVM|nr:RECEPTOR-LIKE PROTEIN KINASE HAIKU2 [Salix viminalis]